MGETMRISAKGQYALAAVISMAQQYNNEEYITVASLAEKLDISKIYFEQAFSLLKRAGLVLSTKGAQGGYKLARMPKQITVLDVFLAVEASLFEQTQKTASDKAPEINKALRLSVFDVLDRSITETLRTITLSDLVNEAEKYKEEDAIMFYF